MVVPRRSKSQSRQERRQEREKTTLRHKQITALNKTQAEYMQAFRTHTQIFSLGPAGTGKTYLATLWGIEQVLNGSKDKFIMSRTTSSKPKHRLGFRPGDQNNKVADWLIPIIEALKDRCGATTIENLEKNGKIVSAAFETMCGRTFKDAIVLLDEAQNCDFDDLNLFLTRTGKNCQVIIDGSLDQIMIPDSGLERVVDMVEKYNINAKVVRFTDDDVVRSEEAAMWVKAFRKERSVYVPPELIIRVPIPGECSCDTESKHTYENVFS